MRIALTVNGEPRDAEVEPRLLLSDFLRHEARPHRHHVGCEHGVCGACTVQLDGEAVRSCLMLAVQADGRVGAHGRGARRTGRTRSSRRSTSATRSSAASARRAS